MSTFKIIDRTARKEFRVQPRKFTRALKLRYIVRLFAKEMVSRNFPGLASDQLLERMIELSLYTEEHLRQPKPLPVGVLEAVGPASSAW